VALIKPFRALRPVPREAAQVASVPYDVVSTAEAKKLAAESPHSFLRVTRSEIDFADGADVYAPEIYERAKENLAKLQADGVLLREDAPCLYIYRLTLGNQTQTGIVACCSVDEYDNDLIKKHEKTRPEKEDDRTRHIVATRAQTGLIFLCYRGTETINALVSTATTAAPLYDFQAEDGVQHTVWRVEKTADLENAFAQVPALYVADGHHRAASASRARQVLREQNKGEAGDYDTVIAALFPAEELKILAYNRVVKDLNGLSNEEFLERVAENFVVTPAAHHVPDNQREFCLYLSGKWHKLRYAVENVVAPSPIEALDVSILQNYLLAPILGITDPRTDKRIEFVGGIRGTKELEKLVNEGRGRAAFSLYPTSINDLLTVSDMNEIMPPKSTWFEPKLRDGLLIHLI
jgi:uncharacterized protein (DUF1015 family)